MFSWLNVVKRIIEKDLPSVNNNNIIIGYHSKKKEDLLPRLLELNIIEWWKSGSIPKDRAWLLVHSSDFNFMKERLEVYAMINNGSDEDTFLDVRNVLRSIHYRPMVSQRDGGYLCGFIACSILKVLYSIDDKNGHERDEVLSNIYYGNCEDTQANLDKAID